MILPSSLQKKVTSLTLIGLMIFAAPAAALPIEETPIFSNLLTARGDGGSLQIIGQKTKITLENKDYVVNYVVIPKNASLEADVVIAQNGIGSTEELSSLAMQGEALTAVNGSFFQSFDVKKPMDPYGILIKNGRLIHKNEMGSAIGFTDTGELKIGIINPVVTATIGNRNVNIDLFNHTPTADGSSVALFNKHRGESINFSYGCNILISSGEVTQIVSGRNVPIPTNGYVINLTGDAIKTYGDYFKKGTKVTFKVSYQDENGDKLNWSNVETAIGAGPILIQNGVVSIDLAKENFSDEKSTQMTIARSAVGLTSAGDVILVSGVNCTTEQLAEIMLKLDVVRAISMNGGAFSGLYVNGQYVVKPSRNMSNALVFKIS